MIIELLRSEKRSPIERWVKSLTLATTLPNGDTLCRVLGEYPCVVTLEDLSIAPHLVMDGYWEMWVTLCLAKRIQPGWQCIDVGANFGYYTLLLAALAGETGRVEAWEPQLGLCERLEKTLRLNGLSPERVRLRHAAVGSEAGQGTLRVDKTDRGAGAVVRAEKGSVDIRPLTDTKFSRVDFVKIDAEGMEPEIWLGGIGILQPKAVLLEWTPRKYADPPEFLAQIKRDGYSIGKVNQHGDVELIQTPEAQAALSGISGWEALWLERKT